VRPRLPRFSTGRVSYRIAKVTGDRYAGEWPAEAFRSQSITVHGYDKDRSALYSALLPTVNAGTIELLDVPDVVRELRGLERRRGSSDRDRVDHRPDVHDDLATRLPGGSRSSAAAIPMTVVSAPA
jgi:hypothetical protein